MVYVVVSSVTLTEFNYQKIISNICMMCTISMERLSMGTTFIKYLGKKISTQYGLTENRTDTLFTKKEKLQLQLPS